MRQLSMLCTCPFASMQQQFAHQATSMTAGKQTCWQLPKLLERKQNFRAVDRCT
jgi:hypothetical protein